MSPMTGGWRGIRRRWRRKRRKEEKEEEAGNKTKEEMGKA